MRRSIVVVCPFVRFPLAIVLSVLLRFRDSDYHFGIFLISEFNDISLSPLDIHKHPEVVRRND